jgi:thioredoxin reductase
MTEVREVELAVVGAGPAGMSAALAAADQGVRAVVVDEGSRAGGQIYRQTPAGFAGEPPGSALLHVPGHERGDALRRAVAARGIEVIAGATVWDAAPGLLCLERAGAALVVRARAIVLATGACDRVVAFPGWTLPGVITAGAAQVMVRGFMLRPGARALVAGTGPLLLPTATALLAAGARVVAVVEACPRLRAARALLRAALHRRRRAEALFYLRALRRHRVDYRFGQGIVRAEGEGTVRAAVVARLDRRGRPVSGSERRLEVDVVCTGYGLVPSCELARLLGCAMREDAARGGWAAAHDDGMQTTVPGVFVAGEVAGIGGADVAAAEGRLAGLSAAALLGHGGDGLARELVRARALRARERRAADALLSAFVPPPGVHELAADDTVLCRCEDVRLGELRRVAELFGDDMRSLKMGTRAGMGPCQGRICQPLIAATWRHRFGQDPAKAPCPVVQAPVKPVPVEVMAATYAEEAVLDAFARRE